MQERWTLADRRFGSIDQKFEDLFNFKLDCYLFYKVAFVFLSVTVMYSLIKRL